MTIALLSFYLICYEDSYLHGSHMEIDIPRKPTKRHGTFINQPWCLNMISLSSPHTAVRLDVNPSLIKKWRVYGVLYLKFTPELPRVAHVCFTPMAPHTGSSFGPTVS